MECHTFLLTGGGSGIGTRLAAAFAVQGAKVGFLDIDAEGAVAMSDAHDYITYEVCDLRDIPALRQALAALGSRIGPAEMLVHNAARDDAGSIQGCAKRARETGSVS